KLKYRVGCYFCTLAVNLVNNNIIGSLVACLLAVADVINSTYNIVLFEITLDDIVVFLSKEIENAVLSRMSIIDVCRNLDWCDSFK
ncbi:hypothetical protein A3Q56_08150, partial [Intoshia linei]